MMVEYWQRLFHEGRLLAVRNQQNPDYVTLPGAFGIKAIYSDAQEDLEGKMKEFLFDDPGKPVLFHVRIERTPCLPLVAPKQPLQNMMLEDTDCERWTPVWLPVKNRNASNNSSISKMDNVRVH
eukprot:scaffold32204_cov31-Attheya_sp.AAC.2